MPYNLQGPEYAQLRAFMAISDALSFSQAAETLGLSPSSLSQMLRALEERLGVRLLNRTTRSVSLTPAGEVLYLRLCPAVREIKSALQDTKNSNGSPSGLVRLHSAQLAAHVLLAPHLEQFRREYPQIVLDITVNDTVSDLVSSGYDIALRPQEVIDRDLIAIQIGPDLCQYPVAAPTYIERFGAPLEPADLARHNCILWRWAGRSNPFPWEFYYNGQWFDITPQASLITDDRQLMMQACINGCGIAFATNLEIARYMENGPLIKLLENYCKHYEGYHLCYPRQRQMAPALRCFVDYIKNAVK